MLIMTSGPQCSWWCSPVIGPVSCRAILNACSAGSTLTDVGSSTGCGSGVTAPIQKPSPMCPQFKLMVVCAAPRYSNFHPSGPPNCKAMSCHWLWIDCDAEWCMVCLQRFHCTACSMLAGQRSSVVTACKHHSDHQYASCQYNHNNHNHNAW